MRLIQIDQNDLVWKRTSRSIHQDIVQRDQAFAYEDKRRQDGKRTSLLQQHQPEAEISPVSLEQDDTTNLPCTSKPATPAGPKEEDEKTTWFLKLPRKRTWFTDTCAALRTMGKALTNRLTPLYDLRPKKRTCKILVVDRKPAAVDISMISAASFVLNC
jgi:hypothetical protein